MWGFESIGAILITWAVVIALVFFAIGLGVSWLF